MNASWRTRTAILSAIKGWMCVWALLLVLQSVSFFRYRGRIPPSDLLSILLIWIVSTGIVTLLATILLIVPYVCLRDFNTLHHKPWLIYVESGAIAVLASLALTYFAKPSAETFWTALKPYMLFALVTSLTSSFFYQRRMEAMSKQPVVTTSN